MKRNTSIGRKVMLVNTILAFVLLGAFSFSFLFFALQTQRQNVEYSDQILQSVSKSIDQEARRLALLTRCCRGDKAFLFATANRLGIKPFVDDALEVSEKLALLQYSLPYAQNVYTFVKSNEKVISLDGAVISKDAFLETLRPGMLPGEEIPDLGTVADGFYSYRNFTLYAAGILDNGTILIKLDPNRFCDLDVLYGALPDYDFIVLNRSGQIFASSDPSLNDILFEIEPLDSPVQKLTSGGETLEVTQRFSSESGFQLLLIRRENRMDQQFYSLFFFGTIVGVIVCAVCLLTVLLNKRIYSPLRSLRDRLSVPNNYNELEAISGKLDELIRENSAMTEQIQMQQDVQLNVALHYALRTQDGLPEGLREVLQERYETFWIALVAAQDESGCCGDYFRIVDGQMAEAFSCDPIQIDPYCHAYLLAGNLSGEGLSEILSGCLQDRGLFIAVGASEVYHSVENLQDAFRQAQNRMQSVTAFGEPGTPTDGGCMAQFGVEEPVGGPRLVPLEIQNTLAGVILSGDGESINSLLESILLSDRQISMRDFVSLYRSLCALVSITLFSSSAAIPQSELKTMQIRSGYNPVFLFRCISEDCLRLNSLVGNGKMHSAVRYQIPAYIKEHYCEPLSLDSIAAEFGITPVYLSAWFKKNLGVNLSAYLSNLRMEKAKARILETRNLKIADLAVEVGIPSLPTFIRQFKNHTGVTPDQYRKLNAGGGPEE